MLALEGPIDPIEPMDAKENSPVTKPNEGLNSKAVSTSGTGSSKNVAGNKRGRPSRKPLSSQSNIMTNYLTPVRTGEKPKVTTLGKRLDKRVRAPDSDDEDDENAENKSARVYVSPTNEDAAAYNDLAKTMHRTGRLNKEKVVALNAQLLRSLEKEKK